MLLVINKLVMGKGESGSLACVMLWLLRAVSPLQVCNRVPIAVSFPLMSLGGAWEVVLPGTSWGCSLQMSESSESIRLILTGRITDFLQSYLKDLRAGSTGLPCSWAHSTADNKSSSHRERVGACMLDFYSVAAISTLTR